MPIIGIGTDIVEISRIAKMPDNTRERLAKRVLTLDEYERFVSMGLVSVNNATSYLAKRWAGKEATAKALGTGIASGVSFQHIEIITLASGEPKLILSSRALEIAQSKKAQYWHISLADEKRYATAFVTLS
ncbi:holo-ACP synthase [Colwellia sp. 4_MG-2023]|jgi:holo-[acyl-carrier protein] synthase|uniref:holo-ACP synthase n=1 Tax=unclassified Colwellia TaxID=196834 RepID=UPI001C0A586E|nr:MULTISPECIES: holo-ACP synthase [unclassified Colwellia]MBU2923229.1 holo-ACP synthase [Colwellia sp. C2M11]MDO6506702.1 holo-ACP synthase [Colwellia sp. 5_MG-2023]MDO6555528.1 holo-ACP synthase [Colwellia sp. 4_MG-2023]MDO6651341.1 holo-ACP synthase [Colwellia sp. 3_MG-2023]MDO6664236.1 holo-ACP synthase [Colwellia sp. 2_MG-2023]